MYGDFVMSVDAEIGTVLDLLDELNIADDTLVIFSSDNGPVWYPRDVERFDHDATGLLRGMKADNWEGGHRVPMSARWPGHIEPGSSSDQTMCLTDIMATCAAIVGTTLPDDSAEDSYNLLPVLLGQQGDELVRRYTLHQTMSLALAIRRGDWKYLDHQGSGGNRYNGQLAQYALPERSPNAPGQLYNLADDPGETRNLYDEHPEIVEELKSQLEEFRSSGRSRP